MAMCRISVIMKQHRDTAELSFRIVDSLLLQALRLRMHKAFFTQKNVAHPLAFIKQNNILPEVR